MLNFLIRAIHTLFTAIQKRQMENPGDCQMKHVSIRRLDKSAAGVPDFKSAHRSSHQNQYISRGTRTVRDIPDQSPIDIWLSC